MAGMNLRKRGRLLRRRSIRRQVRGTEGRPRLCVYRSNKHLYAQVISDESGRALAAVSTLSAELKESVKAKTATVSAAKEVGQLIAKKCQEQGIRTVVFDRNGFLFHGRIRAVAEGAREAGLQF
mgnify:FL=1